MEMPVKFELSVMQVGNSLRITIPKEVAAHLKIKKGDIVELWVDNQHIIIQKKERCASPERKLEKSEPTPQQAIPVAKERVDSMLDSLRDEKEKGEKKE